jgi:hypothetical protein
MPTKSYNRTVSLLIALLGLVTNFAVAVHLIAACKSIRWEPESEWESEGTRTVWKGIDGVKLAWGMLSLYFASSAAVCFVGFYGIIHNKASHVRFYRDYSIADFILSSIGVALSTYAISHASVRTAACEELSRQPELMRDLVEVGLSTENCEQWIERVTVVSVAGLFVVLVMRLHFLLAVSKFYSSLTLQSRLSLPYARTHGHSRSRSHGMQRIYLLPSSSSGPALDSPVFYTPVPLESLPADARASATEAWVTRGETESSRHSRIVPGTGATGRIILPVTPNEPLFSSYADSKS